MTQQSLIIRLKAVEEALTLGVGALEYEAANYHNAMKGYRPEKHAAYDREVEQANAALSDLRELIKKSEEQKPVAYGDRLGTHLQSVWLIPSTGVPLWMSYETPLYTSLGERPAAAEQQQAKEMKP